MLIVSFFESFLVVVTAVLLVFPGCFCSQTTFDFINIFLIPNTGTSIIKVDVLNSDTLFSAFTSRKILNTQ